tara:strand:+ start:5858 stop:6772 length:915 start_codon:yes stop_codon:yes gene_type:complete
MIRKAAIDIGTNTTRLLIADLSHDGNFTEIFCRRIITRLGEGLYNRSYLNDAAVQRTLDALVIYSKDIKKFNCSNVRAVATSAVREAENGEEFVRKAKRETGLHLEVIDQEEEARLATLGVLSGLREKPELAIIFDVGGGSTEFIFTDNHADPIKIIGLPIGVVHLTEKHIKSDPVNQKELSTLKVEVKKELTKVKKELGHIRDFTLIGTAGTSTQFAALDLNLFPYDAVAVNGHKMSFSVIENIFAELKSKTAAERKAIRAMEHGREDLIIAGGVILLEVMGLFKAKELTISDFGLREGIIIK